MNDAQFRDQVRRDALRAGCDPKVAQFLADNVGKMPSEAERAGWQERGPRFAAAMASLWPRHPRRGAPAAVRAAAPLPMTTDDRRAAICRMFQADALAADFARANLPLRSVAAMLANAANGERLTPAGIARLRLMLWQPGSSAS